MTSAENHPLKHKWTLWEHRSNAPEDSGWMDQFYQVATVETVEKFWALWGHYPLPSQVFAGSTVQDPPPLLKRGERASRVIGMAYFREGIPPETRAKNSDGTLLTGSRSILDVEIHFNDLKEWDNAWETLALTLVGESVVAGEDINGIWIANRTKRTFAPGEMKLRLEIWWASLITTEGEALSRTERMIQACKIGALKKGWSIRF